MLPSEKDAYAPFINIPLEAALGSSGGRTFYSEGRGLWSDQVDGNIFEG